MANRLAVTALMALLAGPIMAQQTSAGDALANTRPHLFFPAADVEQLRAKCAGPMRAQFDEVVRYADEHIADEPPAKLEGDNEEKGLKVEHPFLTNILDFSFLYVVTGEKKYFEAAKRWTMALARMEEWEGKVVPESEEGDRGLYTGFGLTALAAAYDWLYGDLSVEERASVRAKIAERAEAICRASFRGEWWSGAYLHHDLWIPVGGMGLGAVAIMDETPQAREWAGRAEEEFEDALKRLGDDGAWPEGPCGWAFAMASFAPFWDAYSRRFPTHLDESRWLQETWRFRLYSRMPDGSFIAFGDGRPTGHYQWTAHEAGPTLRLVAKKFVNPYAQWLAGEEWKKRANPYTAVWEIIWTDTEIEEKPPFDLPRSAVFQNQGLALVRTGWQDTDTVVALHCDSLVGEVAAQYYQNGDDAMNTAVDHTHADANSLVVWSRGGFALRNAGYGQPNTEFENSLLVDGQRQHRSFDRKARPGTPSGKITRFFAGDYGSLIEGEAGKCYPPGLDRFTRRVFLVEPGVVFVVDGAQAKKEALFEWLFHVDRESAVAASEKGFKSVFDRAETVVRVAAPGGLAVSTSQDRLNTAVRFGATDRTKKASLIAAILPCLAPDAGAELDAPTESSLVVEANGWKIMAAFAATGEGAFEVPGRVSVKGQAGIATVEGATRGFLAVDATELTLDGRKVLTAPVAVSVSCRSDSNGGNLTIEAREPTQVAIDPGISVMEVARPDGRGIPYLSEGPRIILNAPKGTTNYVLVAGERQAVEGN